MEIVETESSQGSKLCALYIPAQHTTLAKWDFSKCCSLWTPLRRPVSNRKSFAVDLLISVIKGTGGGFILLAHTLARWEHRSGKCAKHPPTALGLPRSVIPVCPAAQCPSAGPAASGAACSDVESSSVPSKQCCTPALREAQVTALAAGAFLWLSESLGCVTHLTWASLRSLSMHTGSQNEPLAVSQLLAVIHLW